MACRAGVACRAWHAVDNARGVGYPAFTSADGARTAAAATGGAGVTVAAGRVTTDC